MTEPTGDGASRDPLLELSPAGASRLGGLLAGLDQLDPILALPSYPEEVAPLLPFGRHRLRSKLGAGAHGVVLLAAGPELERAVIVKVPQAVVLADPELCDRFVREARATAGLDHPGIVSVLETGEVEGLPYLVAEYVPGGTLARWLDRHPGPVPPVDAASHIATVAAAVHHAHERGVLHCDLTPSNVLLYPRAGAPADALVSFAPAVTDFGLARIVADDPALTRTFRVAGTPLYMAPEQARGERRNLTARTDVYALGAILFHLLTGHPPFLGGSGAEVLVQVQSVPARWPGAVNARVPADLQAVCLKCLEKAPHLRYGSAAEFAADLNRYLFGYPVLARRTNAATRVARWIGRNPLSAASAVVVSGLGVGLVVALASLWAADVRHAAELREAMAAQAEAKERAAVGEFLATFEHVRQRREDREPDWPARNLADLRHLAASPVAPEHLLLLCTEAAAALGETDLGTPRAVAEGFKAYNPAFSPDGATLALGSWLPDATGTCTVVLLDPANGAPRRTLRYPADNEWERRYSAFQKAPVTHLDGCRSLTFSPDGRWLVLGTRSGWLVRWDLKAPAPEPTRWRHARPLADPRGERVNQLAFGPSGRVLVSGDDGRLVVWAAERQWPAVLRKDEPSDIVFPATHKDPLRVKVGSALFWVRDSAPWLIDAKEPFDGARAVAGPGGRILFVDCGDNTIRPFAPRLPSEPAPGGYLLPFTTPGEGRTDDGFIGSKVVSSDGLHFVTAAEHIGHLRLWSVTSGQLLSARTLGPGSMRVAFAPDGRTLAVCQADRTLLFDIPLPRTAATVGLQPYPLADAALAGDAAALLGTDPNGLTVIQTSPSLPRAGWAAQLRVRDLSPPVGGNSPRVALAPDGEVAFTAGSATWRRVGDEIVAEKSAVNLRELQFGPDRRLWSAVGALVGWSGDGSELRTSLGDSRDAPHVTSIALDRSAVFAGLSDGAVCRIDATTGDIVRSVRVHGHAITGLAGSDEIAVAGSALGAVRVVNVATGRVETDLPGAHRDEVTAVAFGPGGWFATGSRDRMVRIWDPAGRPVLALAQTRPVRRVFWSADGHTLTVLAEGERAMRRWDLAALKDALVEIGLAPALP